MRSFWWIQLYMNLFQHLSFHNIFHSVQGTRGFQMRQIYNAACVPPKTSQGPRSTKLWDTKCSPELAFRSMDVYQKNCDYYDISDFKKLKINKQFLPFQYILTIWELSSILSNINSILYVFQKVEFPESTHKQTI